MKKIALLLIVLLTVTGCSSSTPVELDLKEIETKEIYTSPSNQIWTNATQIEDEIYMTVFAGEDSNQIHDIKVYNKKNWSK